MELKSVVLPAPLGPIRDTTVFGKTSNEALSSAVNPPKRTVSPETWRSGTAVFTRRF